MPRNGNYAEQSDTRQYCKPNEINSLFIFSNLTQKTLKSYADIMRITPFFA